MSPMPPANNTESIEPQALGELGTFEASIEPREESPGVTVYKLRIEAPGAAVPPEFSFSFKFPLTDLHGKWTAKADLEKTHHPRWHRGCEVLSRTAQYAPVISLFNQDGQNRITYACSDVMNTLSVRAGINEHDAMVDCEIFFFQNPSPEIKVYETEIRVDQRAIPYHEALKSTSDWWAAMEEYTPMPVPAAATEPVYSTWYNYHQKLDEQSVLNELAIAKEMGYGTVIVDDGWQTLDDGRGYAYAGDWEPDRIPEMAKFVKEVHKLGMNFVLWYSVPFVGVHTKNYEKFKGKYLRDNGRYATLDPRYPEVREHLIGLYAKALREWKLDGFKLDFIDQFIADEQTTLTAENGRDFASVDLAVDHLMTGIMDSLKSIKPNIIIEFRQAYIGPLMRKYGNMFRAADCPESYLLNRVRTTDIRLLAGRTAVHSDMIMWHRDEPAETAAFQFLNILFSVPQVSVFLDSIPESHFEMLRFWTAYWLENKETLIAGEFIPINPIAEYPVIKGRSKDKTIIGIYEDHVVRLDNEDGQNIDLVNAKRSGDIIVDNTGEAYEATVTIRDCQGKEISHENIEIATGLNQFYVPASGLVEVKKM